MSNQEFSSSQTPGYVDITFGWHLQDALACGRVPNMNVDELLMMWNKYGPFKEDSLWTAWCGSQEAHKAACEDFSIAMMSIYRQYT